MELWDVYDVGRNKTDKTNMWDVTVGGSAIKGDTSQTENYQKNWA